MKKLLDGLYLCIGTFCLFGFPVAMLAFSALFGDQVIKLMHAGDSTSHSLLFQIEAVVIVFVTSAGGVATALAVFAVIWVVAQAVLRASGPEPMPEVTAAGLRPTTEQAVVGHIDHSRSHRRTPARVG